MELLAAAGNNSKAATQVVRTMTLLTRSFENEAEPGIKLAFRDVSLHFLDILKQHSANPAVRDATILFFHRMIIVMGTDVLPLLKDVINVLSHDLDSTVIASILKTETLALVTWKDKAFSLFQELSPFMLDAILGLGFPAAKLTDSDRAIVDTVCQFERLIKTAILLDPLIIFGQPIEDFTKLIDSFANWSRTPLDETVRRFALSVLVLLLGASLGCLVTSENSMTLLDQTKPATMLSTTKPMHVRALLQKMEASSTQPMEIMDPSQPMDAQSCNDLAVIHVLLSKAVGAGFVEKFREGDKMKEVLEGVNGSHGAKEYRDVIKHIMLNKIQKG